MASKYDDDDEGYADSKYADEGESKSGGGGGGGAEAKGSGGGGSSADVGVVLPPIVQAFAHHVMSKKYRDAVEKFFAARCGPFQGVDPKAEQLLEYTDVYMDYVKLVEGELEGFLAKHGVSSEELFSEVQDVMRQGDLDDEFLPAILRVAEYSYFMEQMVLSADHKTHLRKAMGQSDGGDSKTADEVEEALASVTGVWRVDKKRTDFGPLDLYLAAIRVPAVFRGLAKGTFFSNKELVVLQGEDSISIVTNSPFGMQRLDYLLDSKSHAVANPWGAEVPVRADLDLRARDGVEVRIEQSQPAHLPRGSTVTHAWCAVGRALRCTMTVNQPGRSEVSFAMYYTAVTEADLAPKHKASKAAQPKGGGQEKDAAAQAKGGGGGGGGDAKGSTGGSGAKE